MRLLPALCLLALSACKKPPEAPAKLDELCAYLYTHMSDEEDDALTVGLGNLDSWLDNNLEATFEGYTVDNLDEDTVSAIYGEEIDLSGLVGAAVGNDSVFSTAEIMDAVAMENQVSVFPDTYEFYERSYDDNKSCFAGQDCGAMEVDNHSLANYTLGLTAESWTHGQYRWVEIDSGWALIQRTWMTEDVVMNYDWIELDNQFYFAVTLPRGKAASRRLQATWMVARLVGADVPEATALNMVIGSMQDSAEAVDVFLEEN